MSTLIPTVVLALVASTPVPCTPDELAYYESRGWDAYECDGDKASMSEVYGVGSNRGLIRALNAIVDDYPLFAEPPLICDDPTNIGRTPR